MSCYRPDNEILRPPKGMWPHAHESERDNGKTDLATCSKGCTC